MSLRSIRHLPGRLFSFISFPLSSPSPFLRPILSSFPIGVAKGCNDARLRVSAAKEREREREISSGSCSSTREREKKVYVRPLLNGPAEDIAT